MDDPRLPPGTGGLESKTRQGSKWGQEGREPAQQEHTLRSQRPCSGSSAGQRGPGHSSWCPAQCPHTRSPVGVSRG